MLERGIVQTSHKPSMPAFDASRYSKGVRIKRRAEPLALSIRYRRARGRLSSDLPELRCAVATARREDGGRLQALRCFGRARNPRGKRGAIYKIIAQRAPRNSTERFGD